MALYGLIAAAAVVSRFAMLGARVMSHDESMHAFFSLELAQGHGYIHDPRLHGPLQFFLAALSMLLFGANDAAARVPAALAGVALVLLPIGFRPWLGKKGALVTSVGLLISPSLLFYQRYIRNDALIALFTVLLALSLFRYMRSRRRRWLVVGAAAVALSLSTKEVALIHGFLGVLFIGAAALWEQLLPRSRRRAVWGLAVIGGLLAVAAVFLFNKNLALAGGLLLAVLAVARNANRREKPVFAALQTLKNVDELFWPILLAMVIFTLLYTAFFTNLAGLNSGTVGAVSHWLGQQSRARGGQPWYYYTILLSLYEFLPLLVGGAAIVLYLLRRAPDHTAAFDTAGRALPGVHPSDGGTFAAYLIFWAVGSALIYSWAGEKMPWLTVHIALPLIFLAGHLSQHVLSAQKQRAGRWLFAAALVLLAALSARFAWLSSFVNYDYVNELLVYAHGAPDIKQVLHNLDELSRRTAGDRQIKVAYGGIPWPLDWYMRNYPNRLFFGNQPSAEIGNAPVVIFAPNTNLSDVRVEDVEPYLGNNYVRFDKRLVWWPVEDYKGQSLSRLWHSYIRPAPGQDSAAIHQNWANLWRIFFYRATPGYNLNDWPNRTNMYVFVRKDLADKFQTGGAE